MGSPTPLVYLSMPPLSLAIKGERIAESHIKYQGACNCNRPVGQIKSHVRSRVYREIFPRSLEFPYRARSTRTAPRTIPTSASVRLDSTSLGGELHSTMCSDKLMTRNIRKEFQGSEASRLRPPPACLINTGFVIAKVINEVPVPLLNHAALLLRPIVAIIH
jgi:hypothetical protein